MLAVLLLRGPQTLGELRARTERMHPFAAVEQVQQALDVLSGRDEPLAARLERQPGRKEARWAQLLAVSDLQVEPVAGPPPPDELAALRDELAELRARVEALEAR